MQTVYIDLYFFINFSMDFLCLYLTARILSERLSPLRGILASVIGGVYACSALLLGVGGVGGFAVDLAFGLIITAVALAKKGSVGRVFLQALVFAATSTALGGIMTALFYLFNKTGIFDFVKETDGDGISVWIFFILALISGVLTLLGGKGLTKRLSASEVMVEITIGGRTVTLRGISDSGNLLCEPLSGKPCVIVDRARLASVLPSELVCPDRGDALSALGGLCEETRKRVVLIPASTATGEGMLVGLRAERIVIEAGGKKREADAVIALSDIEAGALVPSCLLV